MTLPLSYYQFSRDFYYIVLSNAKEFQVLDCLTYEVKCRSRQFGGIRFLTPYGLSNLMMVVSSGELIGSTPRYLYFWKYTQPPRVLNEIFSNETIEDCQWNYQYISFITENQVYVYDFSQQVNLICQIQHYPRNLNYALSMNPKNPYLFFTSPSDIGNISIYDLQQQRLLNKIQAHQTNITQLAINHTCTMIATASGTGTIIRVFTIPSGEIIYSFRIHNFPVKINHLSFCEKSIFLLIISDNGKISIGLVNDKYRKDNVFYYNQYGRMEQEQQQIVTAEDEDGFLSVFNQDDDNNDDTHSQYTSSHRSYFTSQTRNYSSSGGGLSDKKDPNQGNDSGFSIFNIFNRESRQQIMDVTLTGIQKVREYSQEFFSDERRAGSFQDSPMTTSGKSASSDITTNPSNQGKVTTTTTTSAIPIHIDKKVTRPLFQAKISIKDFEKFTAILKYIQVNNNITPGPLTKAGSNASKDDNGTINSDGAEERDFDDNVSELTDTHTIAALSAKGLRVEEDQDDVGSVRSRISHTRKQMPAFPKLKGGTVATPVAPIQPLPPTGLEELKLLLLSKDGLFQR